MKLLNKINNLLLEAEFEVDSDDPIFTKMANLILSLDPEKLSNEQIEKVSNIVEDLDFKKPEKNEEIKAKKELATKKQYANSYYRKNKDKIKKKKVELNRSIEGQKRNRIKPIMAKQRKTPTGRHKVSYNT